MLGQKATAEKALDTAAKGGEEDLSMEEILQSIRRIIADDTEEDKSKATASAGVNGAEGKSAIASDILELTDMIEDDGSITNLKETAPKTVNAVDVLDNIDAALAPKVPAAPISPQEIKPEAAAQVTPPAAITKAEPVKAVKTEDDELEALLSKTAEEAAVSALSKLKVPNKAAVHSTTPSPEFRSGKTVEDLVEELLKPMMKDWLDNNLPAIVERIVEREVERLTRR